MKKISIGLALIFSSVSVNSFAALNCSDPRFNVYVPANNCGGFLFGLTGLYWRSSRPYLDFALHNSSSSENTVSRDYHSTDPDYNFGFKLNVGYAIPCSANDIMLTYTHYDQDHDGHSDQAFNLSSGLISIPLVPVTPVTLESILFIGESITTVPALPILIFSGTEILSNDVTINSISTNVNFQHNAVDLDFGQRFKLGCNGRIRWYGGLRYAHLETKIDETINASVTGSGTETTDIPFVIINAEAPVTGVLTTFVTETVDADATAFIHQKSDFDGIGPRFGVDAGYTVGGGFGIVGGISTALIVGQIDSSIDSRIELDNTVTTTLDFTTTGAGGALITGLVADGLGVASVTTSDQVGFRHPREARVVPNIDAKIGIDYTYQFCNASRTRLSIEAGYCVSHYWNANDHLSLLASDSPERRTRHTTDVSFDGPYLGIQVAL